MAIVHPFRAVRPAKEFVKDVASYPYDVIDSDEARKIAEGNPRSFLHVVKSEIDLSRDISIYDQVVYKKAKENLQNFINEGTLLKDEQPCFYIYRQKMRNHEQYGLVAGASVEEYEAGSIKKHELTRADKLTDRTTHINVVNAQTGPIFLTYKAVEAIDKIIEMIAGQNPEYDFTADDGIAHTVWVVSDEGTIRKIKEEFSKIDSLYIADGHHRTASAAAIANMRRENNPNHTGKEEYNFIMAVIFPHDQLKILDYNRVVKDLNGLTETEFIKKIAENFDITEGFKEKLPQKMHEFGMYFHGKWYRLSAKKGTYDEDNVVENLDVTILQKNLLDPVLNIVDVRKDNRINFVGGIRGMAELERLVDSGNYIVAFSMYAPTLDHLIDVADQGKIMPPKSTWFEPKLRSGIIVHVIE